MGEPRESGSPGARVPLSIRREGVHPGRISERGPAVFGDPKNISPLERIGRVPLRPQDATPIALGFDLPPISSDEQALMDARDPLIVVVPDTAAPKEGEKPKIFKTVKAGAILLSTADVHNPDVKTAKAIKDMRVQLTSRWGRDNDTGLLYVAAKFINYVDPQHPETNITDERLAADQADFTNAHLPFLMPSANKPPTSGAGEFYLAFRPPNRKGAKGHWVTSVFE